MERPLVLSVDVGTSSLRALVFDACGRLVPQVGVQVSYEPQTTPDGGAFLDADWLLAQVLNALEGVTAQLGEAAKDIAAVAMCTVWHSVLGVDKSGNAVTPFLLWADSRCAKEADELKHGLLFAHQLFARQVALVPPNLSRSCRSRSAVAQFW